MTEKSRVEVVIGGKVLTMSGYESAAYMQNVASHINRKIQELEVTEEFRHLSSDLKPILIEINLTDELMKAKEQAERLEADIQMKEKELAQVKQELVETQIKLEKLEKTDVKTGGNKKR